MKNIKKEKCIWEYDDIDDYYNTSCKNTFCFTYSKREKEFKFCPYCGKKIIENMIKNKKEECNGN